MILFFVLLVKSEIILCDWEVDCNKLEKSYEKKWLVCLEVRCRLFWSFVEFDKNLLDFVFGNVIFFFFLIFEDLVMILVNN